MDADTLVASAIAALLARFITHPLDTIKTRIQISRSNPNYEAIQSAADTRTAFYARWPLTSLYRGLSISLLFCVPALAVYLTSYETVKDWLSVYTFMHRDSALNHLISGCIAEMAGGIFFTPMEVLKSCMQSESHTELRHLASKIWKQEGILGFYKGYWITLAVFVPHTMVYFVVYERLKMLAGSATELSFPVYLMCAIIASGLATVVSTPLDIVKTRWQISSAEEGAAYRQGPWKIIERMWITEGEWRAFTRGMLARIAWGIPNSAISMSVFESLRNWFILP
ncbi:mitochondrial carrier domain-containing protein [Radiomyces spectabilis]|uniref:mitochondrial carrier domain-containing protein n=1 Tax=Radiomyces spectabilis TaxID=64574 RepID=UPI00221F9D93|nr:mitochondrial carrier domain-containing protein [Radiomyces spectabilis]KAI8388143.1 mitochondrial carrier domain-containing protein [Radiomyces spectabilis]